MSFGTKFLKIKNKSETVSILISYQNIVDAVASFLYSVPGTIHSNKEIISIDFPEMHKGKDGMVELIVTTKKTKEVSKPKL